MTPLLPLYSVTAVYHAQHSLHRSRLIAINAESAKLSLLIADAPPARRAYYRERYDALRQEYIGIVMRYQVALDTAE